MGLDLPAEAQWRLSLEADGEYYVTADGRTSKAVSKLMRLKRVRKILGVCSCQLALAGLQGVWMVLNGFEGI